MHADDDSFVRLDLLLKEFEEKPKEKLYWGYIWNSGLRTTRPIRDPTAKSYMPYSQFPKDEPYPPFASGCGFILTRDLVTYLVSRMEQLTPYRLDVAFGIWLEPLSSTITIENEDRIRPYRHLPLFHSETIVQHYMR